MRCPYCQNQLQADVQVCPFCQLSFERACQFLGPAPRLAPVVMDTTRLIHVHDQARIRQLVGKIQQRFPQLRIQVVVHRFPVDHPFSLYAFWLLNAATFEKSAGGGKGEHTLLFVLDPGRGESAIIPSYSLEPILPYEAVDHLLVLAGPAWQNERWADGILQVLAGLDRLMETIALLSRGATDPAEF